MANITVNMFVGIPIALVHLCVIRLDATRVRRLSVADDGRSAEQDG